MNKKGKFVISLDFELHWGCVETKPFLDNATQQYFINTRIVIPNILSIFEEFGLHATWAIVGMLFNKNSDEWQQSKPFIIPSYNNPNVSVYEWVKRNGFAEDNDPFHFASEIIQKIKTSKHQEMATHTYSHYFCLEKGQTTEQFREDLRKAVELANENGLKFTSLVFPRNQYNDEYISVCGEFGIQVVRTCPDIWYWSPTAASGFFRKLFRTGDAYLKITPIRPVFLKEIKPEEFPIRIPASRLFRPWNSQLSILNKLKLKRILNEMTAAAKTGAYYHLWWHPENFGSFPNQCLAELRQIAQHYFFLNEKYGFESCNMQEIGQKIIRREVN